MAFLISIKWYAEFTSRMICWKLRIHAYSIPFYRERPAAIPIEIKSIDDTSNFDDFPESDILQPGKTIYNVTTTIKSL